MIRVRALNESSNDVRRGKDKIKSRETKEAQEVQAYNWYNSALLLRKNKCFDQASEKFNQILKTSLVTEAASTLVDEEGEAIEKPLKNPGLVLKYSSHKNLAAMESEQGNLTAAMEHYLEAVKLDTTDVTLWVTIGTHAISLGRFYLAKHAFNCGLQCNQLHWPCMDHLITVLFILYDFEGCLMWIAKALEREPGYTKAIVYRDQIFNLCPHLQRDTYHLFRLCSSAIYDVQVEDEVAARYLQKAEELRERHRQACLPAPLNDVTMNKLSSLDWHSLGSSLLTAYQQIMTSSSSDMGFHSKVKVGNLPSCRTMLSGMKLKRKDKSSSSPVVAGRPEVVVTSSEQLISGEEDSIDSNMMDLTTTTSPRSAQMNNNTTGVTFNFDVVCGDDVVVVTSSRDDEVKRTMDEMVAAIEENDDVSEDVRRTMDDLVTKVEKSASSTQAASVVTRDVEDGKKKRKRKSVSAANQLEDFKKRRSTRNRTTKKSSDLVAPPVDETPNSKSLPQSKQSYMELIKEVIPHSMVKLYDKSTYKQSYDKHKSTTSDSTTTAVVGGKTAGSGKKEKKKETTSADMMVVVCDKYDEIQEGEDVILFIEAYQHKTIVDWLQQYCRVFATKKDVRWRRGTRELLVKISNIILPHVTYPEPDDVTEAADYNWIRGVLLQILTCIECQVDLVSSSGVGNTNLIENKLEYLSTMVPKHEIYDDDVMMWEEFVLRVQWCKYKFACATSNNEEAMILLSSCSVIITAMETRRNTEVTVNLPNHSSFQSVSYKVMMTKMQEYERSQLLDDVNGYFDKGEYTNVVSLLLPTLLQAADDVTTTTSTTSSPTSSQHPARAKQLRHLMVAQWKVADRMESLSAMSSIINEICNRLMKRSGEKGNLSKEMMTQQKLKDWKNTLNVLLKYLDEYLATPTTDGKAPFSQLDDADLSNLIYGLVNVVDYLLNYATQMSIDPSMLINSLVILYRVANSMLDFGDVDMGEDPVVFRANLLSSLHDWAGEKRLCCAKDGYLLRVITTELSIPSKDSFGLVYDVNMDSVVQDCLEQTFFCIFTYPARTRANNFDEHFARMKKVTWCDYVNMFNYSKQPDLPQFDSMKLVTINADFAQQIQKALLLLPPQLQEQVRINEDRINLYLDSHCTSSPMTSLLPTDDVTTTGGDGKNELAVLGCMYYLFADFKFKRNELPAAIKFYMHDLALTPNRFDSWAGIALSKSGLTENTLRSCNKTSTIDTERRAQIAVACFQQALSIDGDNVKLWIEYGSFAYWLQAMYSRRIARIARSGWEEDEEIQLQPASTEEDSLKRQRTIIELLEKKKQKMQKLSRHCFENVQKIDDNDEVHDEEWLIEYMIGKHDEKEGKPPSMFLRHYQQAAIKLHNRGAKYPKKIQTRYTQGTNELSGEALEMYYRLHASALSYINQYSPILLNQQQSSEQLPSNFVHQLEYIKEILDEATRCPFVERRELKSTSSTTQSSASNSQEDNNNKSKQQSSSKLSGGVTSSKDFIIGSLVPDNIQQALNYHVDTVRDDDSQQSHSPLHPPTPSSGSQSREAAATSGHTGVNKEATAAGANVGGGGGGGVTRQQQQQQVVATISTSQLSEVVVMVIDLCEKAFRLCLRRYPQHYKAVYRLAGIYMTWSHKQNLEWARDLLYGAPTTPWTQLPHMPSQGLMAEKNKTNLFQGVWRISDDDVDRPGSFSTHLERCVGMLLYILRRLHDNKTLLHIHNLLNRIPDHGRQYLKDGDRTRLARRAIVYSRSIVRCRLHNNTPPPTVTSQLITTNNISYHPLARDFYQPDEDFTRGSLSASAVHCDVTSVVEQQWRQRREISSHHHQHQQHEISKSLQDTNKQMEDANTAPSCDQQLTSVLKVLMDAYKIYQDTNRHPSATMRVDTSRDPSDCSHQRLLAEAYHKYTTCISQQDDHGDTKENDLLTPDHDPRVTASITDAQVVTLVEKAKVFCHQKHRQKKDRKSNVVKSTSLRRTTVHDEVYSNKSATTNNSSTTDNNTTTPQTTTATTNTQAPPPVPIMKRPLNKPPQVVLTPISPPTSSKVPSVKFGNCTKVDNKKPTTEVVLSEGMSGGKVTMVKKDGQTYTKIQPKPPTSMLGGNKRNNLGFVHLQIPQQDVDSRQELRRSSSVPLADEGSLHIRHRALFRTGSSVSDSTKLILRSTIQQGRSAALIRKPSITDHEIRQIEEDDDDNDDDDDDDDDMSGWSDEELPPCKKIMMTSSDLATTSSSSVVQVPTIADQHLATAPMSPLQVITMTTTAAT